MSLTELQSLRKDYNTLTTMSLIIGELWTDGLEEDIKATEEMINDMTNKLYERINKEEKKLIKQGL